MKAFHFRFLVFAAMLCAVSCRKDYAEKYMNGKSPDIPFDFEWKTTRDVALSVASPLVGDQTPRFALIEVFSSPVLSPENRIAQGMVTAGSSFNTAFTLPVAVENIYVQTIVPDGRRKTEMAGVDGTSIQLAGCRFDAVVTDEVRALHTRAVAEAANAQKESSMVVPFTESLPSSYDEIIAATPSQTLYIGGDSRRTNYFIPAGTTVDANISMSGWTNNLPTLYVAGRLVLDGGLEVSKTRLVVLPKGEILIKGKLSVNNPFEDKASVYVFKEGILSAGEIEFAHGRTGVLVNLGELDITGTGDSEGKLKMNGGILYTASGVNSGGAVYSPIQVRASYAQIHTDGRFVADEIEMDASSTFVNYENGRVEVDDFDIDRSTLVQKGTFQADEIDLSSGVTLENLCMITTDKLEGGDSNNRIELASGALLTVRKECELSHAQISMAKHSMFVVEEMDDDDDDFYKNIFTGPAADAGDRNPSAVLKLAGKGHGSNNRVFGLIEIVYDSKNNHKLFSQIKEGATLVREQTVDIPLSECNGGTGSITPAPVDPVDEFDVTGALYTYCYEDNWPWFGDYDMNDLVVGVSIDRRMKEGKVQAIRINWELKASGADNYIAFAACLDKVPTSNISSVVSTHRIGFGPFEVEHGLERDNEFAVVPLFNSVGEVFGTDNVCLNTIVGEPQVQTVKHSATVAFAAPVSVEDVLESAMNMFLVVSRSNAEEPERWREVHLPSFRPTKHAVVTGFNTVLPDMPYKCYAMGGDVSNNGLMWGLMIPGEFGYPSETNDIRTVYTDFLPWAKSGGTTHKSWYESQTVSDKIYR